MKIVQLDKLHTMAAVTPRKRQCKQQALVNPCFHKTDITNLVHELHKLARIVIILIFCIADSLFRN